MGIFKWSANPVPHEFYISLGGLLRNLKFFGKKFGIGMLITLDLLVEPIISFVSKFSSHDFTEDRTAKGTPWSSFQARLSLAATAIRVLN